MKLSSKIILFANFLHTVLFRRTDYFERDCNAIHMTFFGRYTMEIGQFYGKFCFASESWDMPMWLWRCSFSQSRSVTYCSSFETILDCIFPLLSAIPPKGAPTVRSDLEIDKIAKIAQILVKPTSEYIIRFQKTVFDFRTYLPRNRHFRKIDKLGLMTKTHIFAIFISKNFGLEVENR